MAYTALYRKFRPLKFDEMVGQEHITKTLKNQIISGRVGHAYLFSGGRGTGKTSSAKILARAINCLNPQNGEPCNECEICKGILSGSLTDVVEMDAASNNSVEHIRAIRDEVNFLPTLAKYRIYIIDEVHMLTISAFNALLKTLEEPPEHVKFILATTEPQKLPATILSRCQRFDFKRIQNIDVIKRLKTICNQSNIQISDEALNIIAILSEGAMRDALSILERCLQDGEKLISEDKIKELVGIPKTIYIYNIVKSVLEYDAEDALKNIDIIINEGKDLNFFIWEIIKYIKDILLLKTGCELPLYTKQEIEQMQELENLASKERLLKLIYSFSDLESQMKWSTQKTILFQVGLIKACNKQENQGIEELEKRISALENNKILNNTEQKKISNKEEKQPIKKESKTKVIEEKTGLINNDKYISYWGDIVNNLKAQGKIMLYTNLINSRAKLINDMVVAIEFPNGLTSFGKTVLEKPENKYEIEKLVSMQEGKQMQIKYIENSNKKVEKKGQTNLIEELDIPINIIED